VFRVERYLDGRLSENFILCSAGVKTETFLVSGVFVLDNDKCVEWFTQKFWI